jgi:Tol biopolymer transport system component
MGGAESVGGPTVRGTNLVYVQYKPSNIAIWRAPGRKAPAPRPPVHRLLTSSQRDTNPTYSPDGRRIAFESDRSGVSNIWLCDADGGHVAPLTSFDVDAGTPRFSPDGRSIVFDSTRNGNYDLYVVDSAGGVPRQLTHEPSDENVGTWSRDGRSIYFSSNRSGSRQLWKMPATGGAAAQVTRGGGFYGVESSDGRFVYYVRTGGLGGIWRVPATGGTETEVVKAEIGWGEWVLAGQGLYYATTRGRVGGQEFTVHYLDFPTGRTEIALRLDEPLVHRWLAVSPDERSILYRGESPMQSELILVKNFR